MKIKESFRQGKHTSRKFFIIEIICILIIVLSAFIMSERIENEKPNATDFSQNGAIGTETGKYVYLQVDGLSDVIATDTETENEKYYIAINGYDWYIVSLGSSDIEELKNIQAYTYGRIENRPASVTIYGITEEVPNELKQIAVDFYNQGLDDNEKITVDEFDNYFGSVMLNATKDPVDVSLELILILISAITLFVTIIVQICNKVVRVKIFKYLEKNNYEKELEKQLEDNVEKTFFNEKLIITKDFVVDTTDGTFVAVKFSDIKWVYTHRLKYYGLVSISDNIIMILKDGKTQFQCLYTKGKLSDEFEKAFDKICEKLPNDSLKGYTQENIKEFKEYKKELKNNICNKKE